MSLINIKYHLVSVVIPSFNRSNTVTQTIDSIISQQCDFLFEIIIGDDCSTDNTREVLREYQQKYPDIIQLIFHEKNIGLAANWATCVKSCQGKYICNCDNDDYWHNPDKLQLQVDYMELHTNENVLVTNYRRQNRNTGKTTEEKVLINRSMSLQQAFFKGKQLLCNATIMYRKDFLLKHINLDDYIKYQFTLQDWNTWVILSAYTDFSLLPVSTATFGVETQSITRPSDYKEIELRFNKEIECYKYVCELFPQNLLYDEKGYVNFKYSNLLNHAYNQKDFKNAKFYANKVGGDSLRVLFSKNQITFWIYVFLRNLKFMLKNVF